MSEFIEGPNFTARSQMQMLDKLNEQDRIIESLRQRVEELKQAQSVCGICEKSIDAAAGIIPDVLVQNAALTGENMILSRRVAELEAQVSNQRAVIEGKHQYVGQDFQFRIKHLTEKLAACEEKRELQVKEFVVVWDKLAACEKERDQWRHEFQAEYKRGVEQLAVCEKERDELRELAKWREKYCLTGSPEIYDNPSAEFHKWACETHDTVKVGTSETATCTWWEGDDGGPWATQCNELFNIESEGPDANGMKFCCFCGKKLVEVRAESEEENV